MSELATVLKGKTVIDIRDDAKLTIDAIVDYNYGARGASLAVLSDGKGGIRLVDVNDLRDIDMYLIFATPAAATAFQAAAAE